MGYHPRRLFESIAREAGPRAFEFSTQELGNTLWALAKCRHTGPAMPALLHVSTRQRCPRQPGRPASVCINAPRGAAELNLQTVIRGIQMHS